jgi:AraC-like DNA-binding protein
VVYDRGVERRRAVALARHFRDAEGLSIAQIADRLGRSPATIKAYFYDPTGEKARAVKARYVEVCRGCGAYTQPRNGKGDAYAYCKRRHPGAIERRWDRPRVLAAMRDWRAQYGRLPTSDDWSSTHTRRRGAEALGRIKAGEWPAASTPVRDLWDRSERWVPYETALRSFSDEHRRPPGDEVEMPSLVPRQVRGDS